MIRFFIFVVLTCSCATANAANANGFASDDDEWGCTVLLCLANPNGPTAESQCQPPIDRLWRHLRRGHSFPRCTMQDGTTARGAGSWAQTTENYYPLCPTGTKPLARGTYAEFTSSPDPDPALIYTGIGDGSGIFPDFDNPDTMPPLVCVGTEVETVRRWLPDPQDPDDLLETPVVRYATGTVYDAIQNGRAIDVYIDNSVFVRAHY